MTITICGSIKFMGKMREIQLQLEEMGHAVHMPIKADGVDYWAEDNASRVKAKKEFDLIREHMHKIDQSDAILVVNVTKHDVENYIGANTFLEMGFAYHYRKKIYVLNPLPTQVYILDEIQTMEPIVLNGDLTRIA